MVNGSFVTDVVEPNEVDCVVLIDDDFSSGDDAGAELVAGLPFSDIQRVNQDVFDLLVDRIFATDRQERPKGMVEITL